MRNGIVAAVVCAWIALPSLVFAQPSSSAFTTAYRYDAMQRVVGVIRPQDANTNYLATRTTYDYEGRVIEVEEGYLTSWANEQVAPSGWGSYGFTPSVFRITRSTYDTAGRKTSDTVFGKDGNPYALTQYNYDGNGRSHCVAVRMNATTFGSLATDACSLTAQSSGGPDRITNQSYDAAGEPLTTLKAYGTSLQEAYASYTYTPNGQKQTVTNARSYSSKWIYDGFDRLTNWYFPSPSATLTPSTTDYEIYGYDNNGNRTSLRKRDTRSIAYNYDALNRMTSKTYPNGGATAVYYAYDLMNHTIQAQSNSLGGQGMVRVYDGFDELTSDQITLPGISTTLRYTYDANGNKRTLVFPDGNYVYWDADGLDRPWHVERNQQTIVATYSYDSTGHLGALTGGYNTAFQYDPVQRLQSHNLGPANSSYAVQFGFSYNSASQISQETDTNDLFLWGGVTQKNVTYAPNGLDEYGAIGSSSPTYDADGNMTFDGSNYYCYDIENRLVASGPTNTCSSVTLAYDPVGRLYSVSGSAVTHLVYDGDALIEETDVNGNILRRYIDGTDEDQPFAWYEGAAFTDANARYLRADHEGSVLLVTDSTSANIVGVNTYDEYGIPSAANVGRFQYTGQLWIPELALYYYKARVYSPSLGRFMQTDPIGYKDDIDLYSYVDNDPLDRTDPSGLTNSSCNAAEGCDRRDESQKQYVQSNTSSRVGATSSTGHYATGAAANANKWTGSRIVKTTAQVLATIIAGGGPEDPAADVVAAGEVAAALKSGAEAAKGAEKVFSAEKQALVKMAKTDQRAGVTRADMGAYRDLNKGLSDPFPENKVRIDPGHSTGAPHSQVPHGHVGPVDHIPITDP